MNTTTTRAEVAYSLTDANAFELITGFQIAARAAGWTDAQLKETTADATSGDYDRLIRTLARHCTP